MYTGSNLRIVRCAIHVIGERNRYYILLCYRKCMILNYVPTYVTPAGNSRVSEIPRRPGDIITGAVLCA